MVLTQVEVTAPFVCIVSLCSQEPLERLSPRERQVIRLVRKGRSTKEIARDLGIKPRTVETYVRRAYDKLGVHSRVLLSQQATLLG
jgi:DNA-binding CsgD family transcriptional regulator